ncbi:MAG: FtsX-like permease family protein [Gemmatimonadaceae bacterium]|nr:FtsX-like permease family protein [Gemmatimonadaceae bacterium]
MIGQRLAERLNAWPGQTLVLLTIPGRLQLSNAMGGFVPVVRKYVVTGVFETGMYEYDSGYAYMELASAQDLAGLGPRVTGIDVRTRGSVRCTGRRRSSRRTVLGFPYRTIDWQEQNRSLFQALKLEKLAMGVILLLIVLVAAFNIVSTLTMVVTDKTREIGILKAMGMPAATIRRIFLWQGAAIGMVGHGGWACCDRDWWARGRCGRSYRLIELDPTVYFIDRLPIQIAVSDVLWIDGRRASGSPCWPRSGRRVRPRGCSRWRRSVMSDPMTGAPVLRKASRVVEGVHGW